jgi:MYXO-CTERM domain-containing protein
MRFTIAVIIAGAALASAPASAQNTDNTAANNVVAVPAPADNVTAASGNTTTTTATSETQTTVVPVDTNAAAVNTAATEPTTGGDKRLPWGLLGLLGLVGLFGRRRSAD